MNIKGLYQRTKNTFDNVNSKPSLVFLHVPKCGGTSIDTAIKNQYYTLNKLNDYRVYDRVDALKSAYVGHIKDNLNFTKGDSRNNRNMEFNLDFIAYRMLDPNIKYLSGHFPFNEKIYNDFKDNFDFFTILRDPVEKWLSNFYYRGKRYSLIKKSKVKHWEVEDDIESYLDSDRGRFHGYDYAKYYGGLREDYDYTSRESIELAKENLSKFKVVGILEDLNRFKLQMKNFYGFDIDVKHRNKSRSTQVGKGLSQNILENIKEVCKADIEIYEYAKGLNNI